MRYLMMAISNKPTGDTMATKRTKPKPRPIIYTGIPNMRLLPGGMPYTLADKLRWLGYSK